MNNYHLDLEAKIVEHCAPTLAGIKPANLFTCRDDSESCVCAWRKALTDKETFEQSFYEALNRCRKKLAPFGIKIELMARRKTGMLLYVYRPSDIEKLVKDKSIHNYLKNLGYIQNDVTTYIDQLKYRIACADTARNTSEPYSFPHEIGFFLGYPPEDVIAFIEEDGKTALCYGCWKVYFNQSDAELSFSTYRSCKRQFKELFNQGITLEELAWNQTCPKFA